mmetsp:Transcript_107556/g.304141  ORF Transcript_107556/g.304141 Transcript_107556/m.304141 type:complete len:421 (+) Transcript_107556:66-1328(+)
MAMAWVPPLELIQALGALGSGVLAVAGCAVARRLEGAHSRGHAMDRLVACGNTLAAGILLAASLTHMLPDAMEALEEFTSFPLAPAIAGTAFCILVVIGEVASGCMPLREEPHTHTACATYEASFALWPRWELVPPHGCQEAKGASGAEVLPHAHASSSVTGLAAEVDIEDKTRFRGNSGCCGPAHEPDPAKCGECEVPSAAPESPAPSPAQAPAPGHSCHSHSSCCRVHRHSDTPCLTQDLQAPLLRGGHGPSADLEAISRCHVRSVGGGTMAEAKSFLLFFALSFHSVMEGLGMGSAQDSGLLLPVILAVLAHKGLAAFALGCSLTKSDLPSWKFWAFVAIFAAGTPIGCVVGMLTVSLGSAQSPVSGVCIALASGTFLQVSSMELLPRALAEERHKIPGACALCVGFAAMSVLAIWC